MCKIIPHFSGETEVKYLLQGGASGKENLLTTPSGPFGTSLAWRSLSWAYVTTGHVSFPIVLVWDVRDASSSHGRAWNIVITWLMATNLWGPVATWQGPISRHSSYHPFRVSRASKPLDQPRTRLLLTVHCPTPHLYNPRTREVEVRGSRVQT